MRFKHRFIVSLFLVAVITLQLACKKEPSLPDPLEAGWNNLSICEVLEENEQLRVLKCTFNPGAIHEKHYHDPHFGYALQGGTFQITDADGVRKIILNDGSYFYSKGVDWHEVKNIGDSTAVYLIFEPK